MSMLDKEKGIMKRTRGKRAELLYLRLVASFLLVLTLSLPFFSAGVVAAGQIHSVSAQGQDGIEGIIRSTDQITVRAEASIDGEEVTPADIRLGSTPFSSCSASVQGQNCVIRIPDQGQSTYSPRSIPYSVVLKGDLDETLDSHPGSVVVDNRAPTVQFTDVSPEEATTQDITFSYSVQDTACSDQSCSGSCSGIDRVEFFTADGSFSETVQVDGADCSLESAFVKQASAFQNGDQALHARVYDRLGQASAVATAEFSVDHSGPAFKSDSLRVYYRDSDIKHFKPNSPLSVTVQVNVEDDSLDVSSVRADLSALNPSDGSLSNMAGTCSAQGSGVYSCEWQATLRMSQAGAKQLEFTASDTNSNSVTSTLARAFSIDTTGPKMTSLSATGASAAGGSFASATATLVADVSEVGVGLSAQQMYLTVNGQKISASSCTDDTCRWENVDMGFGETTVSLDTSSADLLGNTAQAFSQTFTINADAPTIRAVQASAVGGLTGSAAGFATVGDRIAVVANVSEDTQISTATVDLGDFISGADAVQGSCVYQQDNDFICSWLSDPVENAVQGTATVTITDAAGNIATDSLEIQTFEPDNDQDPNHWTVDYQCAPQTLDRQLGTLIEQRSYCAVSLRPRSSSTQLETVQVELAGCTGDQQSRLKDAELFNGEAGTTEPLLKLTVRKGELSLNQLKTTCTLNIFSRVDNAITQFPEQEQVQITLDFANQPLGEVSEEVQRKIDDARTATEGIWSLIGTLNDLIVIAKKICQLFSALSNAAHFVYFTVIKVKAADESVCTGTLYTTFGLTCAPGAGPGANWCQVQQAQERQIGFMFGEFGNKFCKFLSCQWTGLDFVDDMKKWTSDQLNSLPGANYVPGQFGGSYIEKDGSTYLSPGTLAPDSSLVTSVFFACLPGVVKHLDSYRQIQCLYSDCLQRAVVEDNVPIHVCEDLKAQATCKYITGEIFAIIPYTALFDNYMGMLKSALSDPFSLVGLGIGAYCWATCPAQTPGSTAAYTFCEGSKIAAKIGQIIKTVTGIFNEGLFENRYDYCDRLEEDEDDGSEEGSGGFLGLF